MSALAEMRVGKWLMQVDSRATRAAYRLLAATYGVGSLCTCDYCRNYDAALPQALPPEALSLFERLGIDARCPLEVFEYYRIRPGEHLYGGWYPIIGQLLEGEAEEQVRATADGISGVTLFDHEPLSADFKISFAAKGFLPVPVAFGRDSVLVLDFIATVPWILDVPDRT